ncbi:MAG: GntR family transcriptional regulator [Pseudomonadota bacterium]
MFELPAWAMPEAARTTAAPKAEMVHETLRRAILFRAVAPGEQLLEQTLATQLGCSQGTVREALLRLAGDGLVERRGYRGTFVTETTLAEAAEMVRVRLSIESTVARRLAVDGLGNGPGRRSVEAVLADMDEAQRARDLDRNSELDRAFHVALARAAGMGLLCPVLRRCALHMHRFTMGGLEVPREFFQHAGIGAEHRALLDALLAAEPEAAAALIEAHIEEVLSRWAPSLLAAAAPTPASAVAPA